ncbi:MAG: hypothetical protein H6566_02740 [Lewinellaceae bacterium]|nr:hypothetical protein [Lewinellaceae bacterium]
MAVYHQTLEGRLKSLEEKIQQLSATLTALKEDKGEKARFPETGNTGFSRLDLRAAEENEAPDILGCIEAGNWGPGSRAVRLSAAEDTQLCLSSRQSLYLRAGRHLMIQAPIIHMEAQKLDVDGILAARPSYTGTFTWQTGQPPVRMVHHSLGLPVLTRLEEKGKNAHLGVRMFIDETDGYWYLHGQSDMGAKVVAEAVCFGRV